MKTIAIAAVFVVGCSVPVQATSSKDTNSKTYVIHAVGDWTYEEGIVVTHGIQAWEPFGYVFLEDDIKSDPVPTGLPTIVIDKSAFILSETLARQTCQFVGATIGASNVDSVCKFVKNP